jgi:cytoskeletal protein RodZ
MSKAKLPEVTETTPFGALLRERRQERGISLAEVAEHTCIRRPFLEALEEDRFSELPGEAYVTGFLRNYANFLGLDGGEVIERYHLRFKKPVAIKPEQPAVKRLPDHWGGRHKFLILAGLLATLAALFLLVRMWGPSPEPVENTASLPTAASGRDAASE